MPLARVGNDVIASVDAASSPYALAALEDYSFATLAFTAGQSRQILTRNARRTGVTITIDAAMTLGVMKAPRSFTAAEVAAPTLETGPIIITLDIYRVAVMGDWWLLCPQAGNVSVWEFFRI